MNDLKLLVNKYLFPAILFLVGFGLLIFGLMHHQNGLFIIAAASILIVAIVTFLYSAGVLKRPVQVIIALVFGIGAIGMLYGNYFSIQSELDFQALKKERETLIKQGLMDIRTAQLAYKEINGFYTDDFEALKQCIASDSLAVVKQYGNPEDSLQVAQGKVYTDTVKVSVLDSKFLATSELAKRIAPFHLDSLGIAPMEGGAKFKLRVGQITKSGGLVLPTFEVVDPRPFDTRSDTLRLGSLTQASTNGNWKD